jgi:hypothetical protein
VIRQQMKNAAGKGLRKKNIIFVPVGEGDELNWVWPDDDRERDDRCFPKSV